LVTSSAADTGLRLDCLGISHRTASTELRERAAFSASRLRDVLSAARRDKRVERLAIISTCHRTELYAEAPRRTHQPAQTLLDWWSELTNVHPADLAPHSFALSGIDAARHLFRVTTGLDSVVLGEAQIVSQVASSLKQSVAVHAASPLLKLAFKCAVQAGERARGSVWGRLQAASLGSAAVDAAASAANGLRDRNVIIVGAGEIAELALRSLVAHTPRRITIANRTIETAHELGLEHGAHACELDRLPAAMRDADVVIAATRASRAFIDAAMVATAVLDRPSRPLTLVDVSLPRNVDVAVRSVGGAQLIGIDDLGPYIAAAHSDRRAMIPAVEWIVEEELELMRARVARRIPRATRTNPAVASA
jgi:glutamyl-tRNA reductase